jgi:hypothetical protein
MVRKALGEAIAEYGTGTGRPEGMPSAGACPPSALHPASIHHRGLSALDVIGRFLNIINPLVTQLILFRQKYSQ